MNRRSFLTISALTVAGAGVASWLAKPELPVAAAKSGDDQGVVTGIAFDDAGKKLGPRRVNKVRKTDAEWEQQLNPAQFQGRPQNGHGKSLPGRVR